MMLGRRRGDWVGKRPVALLNVPNLLKIEHLMAICV
jgi:hypothetical protein